MFFHSMVRFTQIDFQIKGDNPFSENYSALGPEVRRDPRGGEIRGNTGYFMDRLAACDALVFAGQAKSHCLNFTLADFLDEIRSHDPGLTGKIYLLEDCTSPVVIPDVVDYTDAADQAFDRFEKAGMHRGEVHRPPWMPGRAWTPAG